MSAVTEYYGYLLSQGYGENQLNKFANYAQRANRGEISHNRAYRLACKAGFVGFSNMTEEEASDKCESVYESKGAEAFNECRNKALNDKNGSFGDWMKTAQEAGWIDKGLGILGDVLNKGNNNNNNYVYEPLPPKKNNTTLYVIGGIA